jgi:hypothetical protein
MECKAAAKVLAVVINTQRATAVARNIPLPTDVFLQTILDTSVKTIEPELRVINIV